MVTHCYRHSLSQRLYAYRSTWPTVRALYIHIRSADLPRLQPKYCTFTCVPLYLVYNWSIVHLYVFHFTLSKTGVQYIYTYSTLPYLIYKWSILHLHVFHFPYLQLEYNTFTCAPLYFIYNWSIVHLHMFHFTLSTTGVQYICMCSTLHYLQLEYSTFTCVPLDLIYNQSILHLHVFHFTLSAIVEQYIYICSSNLPYLQLENSTFTCVHPIHLIYNWSIVHFCMFIQFTLSTTGAQYISMCSSNVPYLHLGHSTFT